MFITASNPIPEAFRVFAGAAAGPAAPIAVPVLSLVCGIGGALGGDALGRYIVDITCTED